VRYTQTVIAVTWAVLRPFLAMVIFTVFFGPDCQVAFPRYPLSDSGFRCYVALAVLFELPLGSRQQSDRQYEPDFESLFSASDYPARSVDNQSCRPAHLCGASWFVADLVPFHSGLATNHLAFIYTDGVSSGPWAWLVTNVKFRFPLCHSLYRGIRTLHFAGRLQ
jgi:hypothetical protein